jgi:SulP family sulfate permease
MRLVPLIDASGVTALTQMIARCSRHGTKVILSGLRAQPQRILAQMGVTENDDLRFSANFDEALRLARSDADATETA